MAKPKQQPREQFANPEYPTFRELLLEKLRIVRSVLPDTEDLLAFCDAHTINYELLNQDDDPAVQNANTEDVTYAIGYMRGAHEAMDITMSEMFENEGIDCEQLETVQ
jgi:hypothetical protein